MEKKGQRPNQRIHEIYSRCQMAETKKKRGYKKPHPPSPRTQSKKLIKGKDPSIYNLVQVQKLQTKEFLIL